MLKDFRCMSSLRADNKHVCITTKKTHTCKGPAAAQPQYRGRDDWPHKRDIVKGSTKKEEEPTHKIQQISFGLSGSACSVHSSSKNLECSAKTFATMEEPYIEISAQTPKNLEWT